MTFRSIFHKAFILVWLWNHSRIRSWIQPVLRNKGKISCSSKKRGPLMGLEPLTSTLWVRCATHCATPPPKIISLLHYSLQMYLVLVWCYMEYINNTTFLHFVYFRTYFMVRCHWTSYTCVDLYLLWVTIDHLYLDCTCVEVGLIQVGGTNLDIKTLFWDLEEKCAQLRDSYVQLSKYFVSSLDTNK